MKLFRLLLIIISISFLLSTYNNANAWPNRVLITNDNGIDDIKIIELAKAFSKVSETWVVAPNSDKSGSSHYLGAIKSGSVEATKVDISDDIKAYAVDGYPADCVILALLGIMKDNPPDLVISGINGGPNLGADWIGSGTIGAARIAGFAGIPAIAVSGLKSDIPGSVDAATKWVVRFAQSQIVQELKPPAYLTLSIPRIPPAEIKGIQIADRSGIDEIPILEKIGKSDKNEQTEIWQIKGVKTLSKTPLEKNDTILYNNGYIVIVPMIAHEIDYQSLEPLKNKIDSIPGWKRE